MSTEWALWKGAWRNSVLEGADPIVTREDELSGERIDSVEAVGLLMDKRLWLVDPKFRVSIWPIPFRIRSLLRSRRSFQVWTFLSTASV